MIKDEKIVPKNLAKFIKKKKKTEICFEFVENLGNLGGICNQSWGKFGGVIASEQSERGNLWIKLLFKSMDFATQNHAHTNNEFTLSL